MAAKTPVKKTTTPLQQQSPDELRAVLVAKQADLLEYKRSLAAGELANPRIITTTRKEIARLKTVLNTAAQTGKGEK